ncbi:TonB-like protein [Nostoc carneum NIES-2107]|nr:TonB-like protein [Nostoc carneum NIES-2107]
MSFSGTTFEQREKETKALKGFLVLSLIGSLGFHVAVLASGVGNYFSRVSPVEEEPIEVTVIDTPEDKKPEQSPQKLEVNEKAEVLTSSTNNSKTETTVKPENPVKPVPLPAKVELPPPQPKQPVVAEPPIQKLVENLRKPIEPIKPQVQPAKPETNVAQKPVDPVPTKAVALANTNPTNSGNSGSNLRDTLRGIRDSSRSQSVATNNVSTSTTPGNGAPGGGGGGGGGGGTSVLTGNGIGSIGGSGTGTGTGNGSGVGSGTGSGTGSGSGSGVGSGTGSGTGSGSGSGVGSGSGSGTGSGNGSGVGSGNNGGERIATTSTTPKLPSSGDGRAACEECNVRYSERARRRKAEGRVAVAVDTDANGKVTNVRLIGSSGDRDLDEEHLRQARNWKLKPSESGRQGVQIATEYAIQGSRRHSQVRKQQQEREERQRQQQTAASSNNTSSEETPRRRRRIEAAVSGGNDVPVTSTRQRRNVESASEQTATSSRESRLNRRLRRANTAEATPTRVRSSEGENSLSNRLRRRQREVTADVRTSGETPQRLRRRRRAVQPSSQPLDSASRLRNALRRSSEAAPAAVPSPGASQ